MSTPTPTPTTPRGVLPTQVNGVPVIHAKENQSFFVPTVGPAVVVLQAKTKLVDEFGDKLAKARMVSIIAYYNGDEIRSYDIRTTRWLSGKLRWRIVQRVKARIRRAVNQIT